MWRKILSTCVHVSEGKYFFKCKRDPMAPYKLYWSDFSNIGYIWLTAIKASSRVAEKASIRVLGMSEIKPTVSIRRTFMFFKKAWWTVTSNVAKSLFSGVKDSSSVSALIRVVFPWKF